MPESPWDKKLDPGPGYRLDDESLRLHDPRRDSWNFGGETLRQSYNTIRDSERSIRTGEVFHNVGRFYFSRNGILVLALSLVLCAITGVLSPEGFFFWNVVIFIIVFGFYEITAQSRIRAEWEDIQEEFDSL